MATGNIDQQNLMASDDDYTVEDDDDSAMTLIEHLEELRKRIFVSLIAIVIFAIVAFIFREPIMTLLELPLPAQANVLNHSGLAGQKLVATGLAEGFTVFLKVSVAVGILASMPVILYQVWAFVSPGLYIREKKYALPFVFLGVVLFAAGITLGFVVLQYPVEWLISFASSNFVELVTADSYFTFVAFFLLAFGVVFEIPLVLTFMAQIGMITAETLTQKRAHAHVGMWVAATFLTPGADIFSPIILGIAMSCLFELTIIFIKIAKRRSGREEAVEA